TVDGSWQLDAGTGRTGRRSQPLWQSRQARPLDDVGATAGAGPGRDRGYAVRFRCGPLASGHACTVEQARLAGTMGCAEEWGVSGRGQPILQPTGAALG